MPAIRRPQEITFRGHLFKRKSRLAFPLIERESVHRSAQRLHSSRGSLGAGRALKQGLTRIGGRKASRLFGNPLAARVNGRNSPERALHPGNPDIDHNIDSGQD